MPNILKFHAFAHPEASNESVIMDIELHSSNQHQSMDKPTKQPEFNCEIPITIITDSDIETFGTGSVQIVPQTEYSDYSYVIIVTLDSDN